MKIYFPIEIWRIIYSFDPTYKIIYNKCINEIKHSWSIFIVDKKRFKSAVYKQNLDYNKALSECGRLMITLPQYFFWITNKNEYNEFNILSNKKNLISKSY